MRPMQCDRAAELIGAYLDQELDAEARREVAAHLGGCPACASVADDFGRLGRRIVALGRARAPDHLAASVTALIADTTPSSHVSRSPAAIGGWRVPPRLRQAAAVLLLCGVTAAATVAVMSYLGRGAAVERGVAAAHVRSLLQDSPTQVASADTHAIKPWFAGRLDFAPPVKDLTADGFPLVGARLDDVGERRVAALVYRRRLHVVNVFLWPASDGRDSAVR